MLRVFLVFLIFLSKNPSLISKKAYILVELIEIYKMTNRTPGGCKTYVGGVLSSNMTETKENIFLVEISKF